MTTALYRRYRPETFTEVIGQEHVTVPLTQALRSGRVNHAYLFSGPRGCGKTTSARILARILNCETNTPEKPVDAPCGECPSCVDLARGGPGSLDVVEIDAASHGGVDDARELRERATFAPARDRYKVFIIDEAHMVTSQGFNALLKIVEEPPPHIKFIFATTEPEKVIGTIRSRTHHYPFRLVPPDVLGPYLESLAEAEGVSLAPGVVPLVVRAGGGSVRDSLSVLDQLVAGASGTTVEYDLAVSVLGYTHSALLDDVVDARAARDGAALFRVVDQVIVTGHAPMRFVDDLLERLRDLIVIAVSGEAAEAVLRGVPADQMERMVAQAGRLGVSELSRAADLTNEALTEMGGATSPRLHLELLCARLLLPGSDAGAAGLAARVERLERGSVGVGAPGVPAVAGGAPQEQPAHQPEAPQSAGQSGLSPLAAARAAAAKEVELVPEPVEGVETSGTDSREVEPVSALRASGPQASQQNPASEVLPSAQSGLGASEGAHKQSDNPEVSTGSTSYSTGSTSDPTLESPSESDQKEVEPVSALRASDPQAPQQSSASGSLSSAQSSLETSGTPAPSAAVTTELVRRRWNEVLANHENPRARSFLAEYSQVLSLDGNLLTLGFADEVLPLAQRGNTTTIADAVYQTLGISVEVLIAAAPAAPGGEERQVGDVTPLGGQSAAFSTEPAQASGHFEAAGRGVASPSQPDPVEELPGSGEYGWEVDLPASAPPAPAPDASPVSGVSPPSSVPEPAGRGFGGGPSRTQSAVQAENIGSGAAADTADEDEDLADDEYELAPAALTGVAAALAVMNGEVIDEIVTDE